MLRKNNPELPALETLLCGLELMELIQQLIRNDYVG